ncbi:MAG: hypothetical protein A2991_03395 [Candidatus Terrybacteria bacterium RIFCSPLOWO2_01_FULL_58_14]|uniref:Uncharacterized protein n=2 Tax=Candidatus Terryibacteriota TaxID=1817920 RepID=A0A1G2PVT2_9BACT|nr:MAG: hypothetical protein A2682_02305 [Candidatus Terrybacteria bacterium RIFCSPHIGHO2_01_FULL_58_15]OHA52425.1 MAG: hypothetical protein A2991_03395 [Candidatus Terrybacteria bacterium RIFCSPLOWO2_01_FULL_58_14]
MPIKRSALEHKWYYRAAKVFFLILPFLILLLLSLSFFLRRKIISCSFVEQSSFPELPLDYLLLLAIGMVLYYVVLKWVWKGFLYIAFGGLEDDIKKEDERSGRDGEPPAQTKPEQNRMAQIVPFVILLIILAIMFLASRGYITLPKIDLDSFGNSFNGGVTASCPATSAQTSTPCGSVQGGIGVSGIIVPDRCECPSDTTYVGVDNTAPGGPYKQCICK